MRPESGPHQASAAWWHPETLKIAPGLPTALACGIVLT